MDSILDLAEERNISRKAVQACFGLADDVFEKLCKGEVYFSVYGLERVTDLVGGTVDFWSARQANFKLHQDAIEAAKGSWGTE